MMAIKDDTELYMFNRDMASKFVIEKNREFLKEYDICSETDYHDAMRGFYASLDGQKNNLNFDDLIKSRKTMSQIISECPPTDNPSYYKRANIERLEGVFEIVPKKIYQVRAFTLDLANFTVVRGKTGWIVIDCMSTISACKKAFELIQNTVENLPVSAIIITHSHGDHFGGYSGVGNDEIPLYVPDTFFDMIFDESVMAGGAMKRRGEFMYGSRIRNSCTKVTGNSLDPTSINVSIPYSKHTTIIKENCTIDIDGIKFDFILTLNTESPADMMMYLTDFNALSAADNMIQAMHNLLTPRGAKVRSGKLWSQCIDDVIVKYGKDVQIHFGGHHWALYGNEKILHFWKTKRDLYKYIHDQTLRYANCGYTPNEIAEFVHLPKSLSKEFCCRNLYGTLNFNIKSQYQLYLGWYDGNPAHLNELPPKELARKYIKAFGGEENTLNIGKEAFNNGDYRWAVTILNHLIFSNPKNEEARELLAKTYDQLSYTQECLVWKYSYATAALELREHQPKEILNNCPLYQLLPLQAFCDLLSVSVNPQIIDGIDTSININIFDTNESVVLVISNCVLHTRLSSSDASGFLKTKHEFLIKLFTKEVALNQLIKENKVETDSIDLLNTLVNSISLENMRFFIAEPKI
ncbi:alkyl sulfatase [Entamoeba histolytica HM-3:IMSS]|uniref:Alkyl sulfatase n=1 Tax=Entamoeba histolytica HM-3:IMSS TaxID=885315 RepID=M7W3R4_ENTHI|nr:alkyl sulfatase [Entamoeba histolytica HM-3:IMSS]